MGRRLATCALALLLACGQGTTRPGANPSIHSRPAGTPITSRPPLPGERPALRIHLARPTVDAGTCLTARVEITPRRSLGSVRIEREIRDGWTIASRGVQLRHGVARVPVCLGATGGPATIRAVTAGATPSSPVHVTVVETAWMRSIDAVVGDRPMSVAVVDRGLEVYGHLGDVERPPASNEKLLLSMVALDEFGPRFRIPTEAIARPIRDGVVRGNVWLVGHGDPELDDASLRELARRLQAAGLRHVTGSVVGDTSTFRRDRGAPGWHPIALRYIGLPTALSFDHNVDASGFVFDPERRAAAALTADLRSLGVHVDAAPSTGAVPDELPSLAHVRSAPLAQILRRQNVASDNLDAETLSKLLSTTPRRPGSIRAGAKVIQAWARERGVAVTLHDASGLSYRDRVTTADLATLLDLAGRQPWGGALRASLPAAGQGTLAARLAGLPVRAKTGTLIRDVSALSGWVSVDGRWVAFSILSRGLSKTEAVSIEDRIVQTIANGYNSVA